MKFKTIHLLIVGLVFTSISFFTLKSSKVTYLDKIDFVKKDSNQSLKKGKYIFYAVDTCLFGKVNLDLKKTPYSLSFDTLKISSGPTMWNVIQFDKYSLCDLGVFEIKNNSTILIKNNVNEVKDFAIQNIKDIGMKNYLLSILGIILFGLLSLISAIIIIVRKLKNVR